MHKCIKNKFFYHQYSTNIHKKRWRHENMMLYIIQWSAESKPTVAIPPKEQATQKQPKTPTVTSPTPPQSPASPSTQSTPATLKKDLSAVHEIPATPPVGAPKAPKKDIQK